MEHVAIAKALFEWNAKNLVHDAQLKKSEIGNYFAENFLVVANGKTYPANYDNYYEFLNQFRSTIRSIDYDFGDLIVDKMNVVIPLQAHIVRVNGFEEVFAAILILKFDEKDKIVLWHEVYLKI